MYVVWEDPRLRAPSITAATIDAPDPGDNSRVTEHSGVEYPTLGTLAFLLAHVPLALLMHAASAVTAVHALVTVGVAGWQAASDDRPERTAYAVAYIAGAEVLWRMTNNQLFWELAKYSVIALCAVRLMRWRGPDALVRPALAFSLLLPSAVLTLSQLPLSEIRNQLSFNLSGPLALVLCAAFFGSLRLSWASFQRICLMLVGPAVGIAAITLFLILTSPEITFSHQSNFALSGGFGPNQVSAALGLGVMMAMLFLLQPDASWMLRLAIFGVMLWLGAQSALTFSRGGLFNALGGIFVGSLFYARSPRALGALMAIVISVLVLGDLVIWPRLDEFTGGNLSMRFQETDTSLRADLSAEDLELFEQHPLFGVGPGLSKQGHLDAIVSHTEFTRLLAEHGLFGAGAMALMIAAVLGNLVWAGSDRQRVLKAALMTWAFLFMANSAMRLLAPSFTFGLAFCVMRTPEANDVPLEEPAAA